MTKRDWDGVWPHLTQVAVFLVGVFVLIWQVVWEDDAQWALVVAALACMGVVSSSAVSKLLGRNGSTAK